MLAATEKVLVDQSSSSSNVEGAGKEFITREAILAWSLVDSWCP